MKVEIKENKVFYSVSSFKGMYNMNMSKAPEWFTEWNKNEFKPLVSKVDNLEVKVDAIDKRLIAVEAKVEKNTKSIETLDKKLDDHIKNGH